MYFLDSIREKRQSGFTNLRINWLSRTSVLVCWDPPILRPTEYILVLACIPVSDGSVSVTYSLITVPGTDSCVTVTDVVNQGDICIFLLYQDPLNNEILVVGTYILYLCIKNPEY